MRDGIPLWLGEKHQSSLGWMHSRVTITASLYVLLLSLVSNEELKDFDERVREQNARGCCFSSVVHCALAFERTAG